MLPSTKGISRSTVRCRGNLNLRNGTCLASGAFRPPNLSFGLLCIEGIARSKAWSGASGETSIREDESLLPPVSTIDDGSKVNFWDSGVTSPLKSLVASMEVGDD